MDQPEPFISRTYIKKGTAAFTLIEVIVIIVVAGIAAGIAAPFLGSALTSSHKPIENLRDAAALSGEMGRVKAKYWQDPPNDIDSMDAFSVFADELIADGDTAEIDINQLFEFTGDPENGYNESECTDPEQNLDCVLKIRLRSLSNPGETLAAIFPYALQDTDDDSDNGNGNDTAPISIDFGDHEIESVPGTGAIRENDTPEGYTYDGGSLILYDDQGNPLVTVRSDDGLRYSENFDSLGTNYDSGGAALQRDARIATGDRIEFHPEGGGYTALELVFRNLSQDDTAEIDLFLGNDPAGTYQISADDLENNSAAISAAGSFDRFIVTAVSGTFGITGFSVE